MTNTTSALRPYPAYRDSGVPWLGAIPAHWEVKPGFAAFREKQQKNIGLAETTVLSLSYGRIIVKPVDKLHGLVPTSFETYQIIDPGDIVIRPTDLQNDWTSLRVGIARNRGIITSAYISLRVLETVTPEYGYLVLNTYDLMKIFYGMGSGLRQNLDFTDLKRLPVVIPPLDEQQRIAAFLDVIDRRVNRFIRAKRRLIALLNEQKQAIIQRAVTRGLDPDVPLKPSGVEWLGDVPEHWEVRRLKSIAHIRYGLGQPPRISETGVPFIRATNVDSGRILDKNLIRVDRTDVPRTRNAFLQENEIIVVRSGAYTADSTIISKDYAGAVAGYDMVVTVDKAIPKFIAISLLSPYVRNDQLITASMRSAQPHLNAEELGSALFFIPTLTEQFQIVNFIQRETSNLDFLISQTEREIELIREYRTRLVADVVTGKLDVRNVTLGNDDFDELDAPLADELGDEDAMDEELPDDEE